jgi:hypothetical protein
LPYLSKKSRILVKSPQNYFFVERITATLLSIIGFEAPFFNRSNPPFYLLPSKVLIFIAILIAVKEYTISID